MVEPLSTTHRDISRKEHAEVQSHKTLHGWVIMSNQNSSCQKITLRKIWPIKFSPVVSIGEIGENFLLARITNYMVYHVNTTYIHRLKKQQLYTT